MIIISAPNCAQPLSLALQGQDAALYGKIDSQAVLWDGLYGLSPWHAGEEKHLKHMQDNSSSLDLLYHDRVSLTHNKSM